MQQITTVGLVLLSMVAVTMAEEPIAGGTRSRLSGSQQVPSNSAEAIVLSQIGVTIKPDLWEL